MSKRKQTSKQIKKSAKFSGKLLLWAIPVVIGVSIGLTALGMPEWLIILANLVAGGATCFAAYVIYDKIQARKAKEPKKPDPFAD